MLLNGTFLIGEYYTCNSDWVGGGGGGDGPNFHSSK